jgi:hypothetical protein
MPIATLGAFEQRFVLGHAGFALRAQGRFAEALPALRMAMLLSIEANDWPNAANADFNVSGAEVLVGEIIAAVSTAEQGIAFANQSGNKYQMIVSRANLATALDVAGRMRRPSICFLKPSSNRRSSNPSPRCTMPCMARCTVTCSWLRENARLREGVRAKLSKLLSLIIGSFTSRSTLLPSLAPALG